MTCEQRVCLLHKSTRGGGHGQVLRRMEGPIGHCMGLLLQREAVID